MKNQKLAWNILGFLSPLLIDLCDELNESNKPQRQIKFHLNQLNIHLQKLHNNHFFNYNKEEPITQEDGADIDPKDVYNITAKAYEYIFDRHPQHIVSFAELLKKLEKDGVDFYDVSIEYEPLK